MKDKFFCVNMQKRILVKETISRVGERIILKGWINDRRNIGKIVFVTLRDSSGIIQVVAEPRELSEKSKEEIGRTRKEWLIEVVGVVKRRNEATVKDGTDIGSIEILAETINVISESAPMPFEAEFSRGELAETMRLKYRYLDIRSERMKNNLNARHNVSLFFRNYFNERGFLEIETPYLTKGTPEGSREFIVPSRLHSGKFYVLPQSPQQFKQLLMVSGVEKYFQIVRCFRDEDQRGDRQPEFTQIDMEMSFIEQEDILNLVEDAIIDLTKKFFTHLEIQEIPFPRLAYNESVERYGSDKPDLRANKESKSLAFCWITDFPLFEFNSLENKIVSVHHPFTKPKTEDVSILEQNPLSVRSVSYDLVLNGCELGGGSLRIFEGALQKQIFKILGLSDNEISERFGHLLEAFTFAPPPHGGIALGLDRMVALLQGEENIREVIAFPKTGDAKDLMMGAPSPLPRGMLKDVHIKID